MKKPTSDQIHVAKTRTRRTIKRRRNKHSYASRYFVRLTRYGIVQRIEDISAEYATPVVFRQGHASITAPSDLSLTSNSDETVGFLRAIRELGLVHDITVGVNMWTIKTMTPTCAMLYASEMDRWKRTRNSRQSVPSDDSWAPHIKSMFNDIGVFDLVEVDNRPNPTMSSSHEKYIAIRSATVVNMEKALRGLLTEVASISTFVRSNTHLYGAISEAITNVRQWAYNGMTAPIPNVIRDRWWFLASYNEELRRFSILVYDHGQGIPATLRRLPLEILATILPGDHFTDADAIEAAFQVPRSATGEKNRGKGLPEMRNLLDKFVRGSLRVVSGKGEYLYNCGDGTVVKRVHKHDIGGTLVAWEIYELGG